MIDHKQNLLDMAEQLERPFWTGPTGADAALVEQAKVLRAAALVVTGSAMINLSATGEMG